MTCFPLKAYCGGLVLLALSVASVHGDEPKATGKGIDAETVAAYEKLGADYGGWVKQESLQFQTGRDAAERGLPGFRFYSNPITKLPQVAVPFGLALKNSGSIVDDAGLKELAGLKNLTALDLHTTEVTDAGLKELAGLTTLTMLNLDRTKVTDAGLKELVDHHL